MKNNTWKILAIVFFAISLIEFIWGYTSIKHIENSTSTKIKFLEKKIQNDSLKIETLKIIASPPGKKIAMVGREVIKLDKKLAPEIISYFENTFQSIFEDENNNLEIKEGIAYIKSSRGNLFPFSIFSELFERASAGEITTQAQFDDILKKLPRDLPTTSKFRDRVRLALAHMNLCK